LISTLLRSEILQDSEQLDVELFDLRALKNGFAKAFHSGPYFVDGHEFRVLCRQAEGKCAKQKKGACQNPKDFCFHG
jgi:hypothetical protein